MRRRGWDEAGWQVQHELGRGAGGVVRAVRNRASGAAGALKCASDPDASARLVAEAAVLGRLRHPNLVRLLDAGIAEQGPWIVTERLGESAASGLASGTPLPEADVRTLGAQVLDALSVLHAAGVVHRDVKPANILSAGVRGRWVLVDLDCARSGDSQRSQSGTAVGTPAYMAPEQRYGASVGPAADLYAVGATLYALARAAPPFELHADDPRAWQGLPSDLTRVLRRATRLDPRDRWPDAASMREALLAGRAQRSRLAPAPGRSAGPFVGAAVLIAAVGGLAWGLLAPGRVDPAPAPHSAGSGLSLLIEGSADEGLGASLASGADVLGGSPEDVAVGVPESGLGGRVRLYADGCCAEVETISITGMASVRYGADVALLARTDALADGGMLVGAPDANAEDGQPPRVLRGHAFYKPSVVRPAGYVLEQAYDVAHAEIGASVEARARVGERALLAYGAPGGGQAPGAGAVVVTFGAGPGAMVVEGRERGARLGAAVALVDVDGDGVPELLAGAPGARGGAGCVYMLRVRDEGRLRDLPMDEVPVLACGRPGEQFGSALTRAGDADGDGADELWVGAPGGDRVLRIGGDGVLAELRGARPGQGFGGVVHARADMPDVVWIGAPDAGAGRAWRFDGAARGQHDAGEASEAWVGGSPGDRFGAAITVWSDGADQAVTLFGAPGAGRVWGAVAALSAAGSGPDGIREAVP